MMAACLVLLGAGSAVADVVYLTHASGSNTDNNREFTFSITVPADAELAVVGVTNMNDRGTEYVRFDGHPNMTFVIDSEPSGMDERAQIFYYINPPAGAQTVRVRLTGDTRRKAAGCVLLKEVDLAAMTAPGMPEAKYDGNYYSSNPTPTLTFTGAEAPNGSLALSVINNRGNGLSIVGAHHTQRWNIETSYSWDTQPSSRHGGGTALGSTAAGVSLSWEPSAGWPTDANWGMAAIVIPPKFYGPTAMTPDALDVEDNAPDGTSLGALTATDPDNKPPYTWTLMDNAGGRFSLSETTTPTPTVNVLIADAALIDFGQNETHTIRVGIRNAEYPTVFEKDILINVSDTTPPVIGAVSASRAFGRDGEMVYFSAAVTDNAALSATPVMTLGGVPLMFFNEENDVYTWAWNIPVGSPDGPVSVMIVAEDMSGNDASRTAEDIIIVDNTAPGISGFSVSHAYAKPGDLVTVQATVWDLNGVAPWPTLTINGTDAGTPSVSGDVYTWQVSITGSIDEGPATLMVTALDVAGNQAQGIAADLLTIDATAPVISTFWSSHEVVRDYDVVQLRAAVQDNYGLATLPQMRINGVLLNPPTPDGSIYHWQVIISTAMAEGNADIEVTATDLAGNLSTGDAPPGMLVIDRTAPSISGWNVSPAWAKVGTAITISAQVTDNYELIGTPTLTLNGFMASVPSQSGTTYTWNYIAPASIVEGPVELTIMASDRAGNIRENTRTNLLTYDPNPPQFNEVAASPTLRRNGQTTQISARITDLRGLDGLPTLTVNSLPATHASVSGNIHTFSYTVSGASPEGDAVLRFWGRDLLGNQQEVTFTEKLMIDKTPPVIENITANPSLAREGSMVRIIFDAYDALTDVSGSPTVTVNGYNAAFHNKVGNHYEYRYTVRPPAQDPDGQALIIITASDTAGNSGLVQRNTILTIDNTAPVISNLTVFPEYAGEGAAVTIGFSVSDPGGLGALPVVEVNGNPAAYRASEGAYFEYSYIARAAYDDDGPALISVRVVDTIGNIGTSESPGVLTMDFTPPTGALIINNNALFTRVTDVSLGVSVNDGPHGSGVTAMSFSDDGVNWSAWEPVHHAREWQMKPGQGYKTVYMRLRDHAGNVTSLPMTDTIALNPYPLVVEREGSGEIKGMIGYAAVLEVTPRNVFGSVQSYEWRKDGKLITEGDKNAGPVLALERLQYEDEGVYVCTVSDDLETADSPPFTVTIAEALPTLRWTGLAALLLALMTAGACAMRRAGRTAWLLALLALAGLCFSGIADAQTTVVYSARAEHPANLSDDALIELALEHGAIELWTRREDGSVRRQLSRLGTPGVANPGFTSFQREDFEGLVAKGHPVEPMKDGSEQLTVDLGDGARVVFSQAKSVDGPTFEMKVIVDGEPVLSEKRHEFLMDGQLRPFFLRVDYIGGALVQVFEYTDTPPAPLPPVYLRKEGVSDDKDADEYPKSFVIKDDGDMQTREVQFIVPPQGLGEMGFDSGWVPGGSGPDPGGFIIQVRINATAGYTYDAAVNGAFNLDLDSMLGLGPAAGSWGFYFGAEFFMKAAFDIPPLFGYKIDPFIVDIPYVPDFNLVTSDRDNFNSWLLEEVSTVRDEGGRTQVTSVDLVSLLITQGVLPELPSWVPLPKLGATLDIGAIANGSLTCDNIALSDGTVYTQEAQQLPVYVPQSGYQAIATYNEDAELNLGVKFYPYVFFSWSLIGSIGFSFRWPTDFEDPDNLLARLEWLPVSHKSFPFTNAELNFTGQPSTQPANDWFTQLFTAISNNDLDFKRVRFTPNLSNNFYVACMEDAVGYRTDPSGGTVVSLGDNAFTQVHLADGRQVSLYGNRYSSFYIGSNGYITFNQGDAATDYSYENHFNQPRISGLFMDLKPHEGGVISWKQLPNRAVVTYDQVRISNIITEQTASFQIEMFFDGRIVVTWLKLDSYVNLVGLSRGNGVPEGFTSSRFTNYPGCLSGIADEGAVRVNFTPSGVLDYEPRWRLGARDWRQSGMYESAPLGQHMLYFNYIPLYWEAPAPMSVNLMVPDAYVDLAPVWTRLTGTVSVNTQPATASWTVTDAEGIEYTGTGPMMLENMPTGQTSVVWQGLPTYSLPTPPAQTVMLYPDATINFTGVYPPIIGEGQATLIVYIEPEKVIDAGARWRVNEGLWLESGVAATIPDGDNTLEFNDLAGWTRPAPQTLFYTRDTTTEFTRAYTRHRGTVWIDPDPDGVPWTMIDGDGVEHSGYGETVLYQIPIGNALSVTWGEIAAYTTPTPNPAVFSLAHNEIKRVPGAYMPIIGEHEGILRVTLAPPAAINAGAQWRLLAGEWRGSGAMMAVPDGNRTVMFKDIPGWTTPPNMTVYVERDIVNDYYASYERLVGAVVVEVSPPTAYWSLTDADGDVHSGMGNAVLENIPSGALSMLWGEIEGYAPPQPNPKAFTLEPDETLYITGEYVEAVIAADFTAFPLGGTPPLEVNFTDMSISTVKDIVEWRWYFGDGRTSTERNPSHVYRASGAYTVTLSVTTQDQMDVVSKKRYITVSEGMPVGGVAGFTLLAMVVGAVGAIQLRRRRQY